MSNNKTSAFFCSFHVNKKNKRPCSTASCQHCHTLQRRKCRPFGAKLEPTRTTPWPQSFLDLHRTYRGMAVRARAFMVSFFFVGCMSRDNSVFLKIMCRLAADEDLFLCLARKLRLQLPRPRKRKRLGFILHFAHFGWLPGPDWYRYQPTWKDGALFCDFTSVNDVCIIVRTMGGCSSCHQTVFDT